MKTVQPLLALNYTRRSITRMRTDGIIIVKGNLIIVEDEGKS